MNGIHFGAISFSALFTLPLSSVQMTDVMIYKKSNRFTIYKKSNVAQWCAHCDGLSASMFHQSEKITFRCEN